MNDPRFDFLKSKFEMSEEVFLKLESLASKKHLKKGEKVVEQGAISSKIYFLTSGLMISKRVNSSGKEYTKNIYSPISFTGSIGSILTQKPSLFSYEALTECEVYEIEYKDFMDLSKTYNEVSHLYSRILEYLFLMYEQKQIESISYNATERYELLRDRIPDIDNQIPQYQIASYLNITPVQLSRIRKELLEN